jgi:hypothetical protein
VKIRSANAAVRNLKLDLIVAANWLFDIHDVYIAFTGRVLYQGFHYL